MKSEDEQAILLIVNRMITALGSKPLPCEHIVNAALEVAVRAERKNQDCSTATALQTLAGALVRMAAEELDKEAREKSGVMLS